jgi:hypothetical protein
MAKLRKDSVKTLEDLLLVLGAERPLFYAC